MVGWRATHFTPHSSVSNVPKRTKIKANATWLSATTRHLRYAFTVQKTWNKSINFPPPPPPGLKARTNDRLLITTKGSSFLFERREKSLDWLHCVWWRVEAATRGSLHRQASERLVNITVMNQNGVIEKWTSFFFAVVCFKFLSRIFSFVFVFGGALRSWNKNNSPKLFGCCFFFLKIVSLIVAARCFSFSLRIITGTKWWIISLMTHGVTDNNNNSGLRERAFRLCD